jgi:hypothetical protein
LLLALAAVGLPAAGCSADIDVGSDVLWAALFEGNNFDEWTGVPGGSVQAFPAANIIEVSGERAHRGGYAAKLTINAGGDGIQETSLLSRAGDLPIEAYYSAWYYFPRTVAVGSYWVIFKFRMRQVADDETSAGELLDLDLANLPTGEMTLQLYDHRAASDLPLDVPSPVVPVASWFHIEAYYRNAPDATGRVTFWLDGRQIVDLAGPVAPSPWVEWNASSVGENLNPSMAILYIDDCAVSRTRVGPTGVIAR